MPTKRPRLWLLPVLLVCLSTSNCRQMLEVRQPAGLCGDGVVQAASEECDDGNLKGGDGCSASCRREDCGNGVKDVGEQCDLGLLNDNDGDCTLACKLARCGDGHLKSRQTPPFEVCDDGNAENGDGCNPQCTLRGRLSVRLGVPGGRGTVDGVGPSAKVAMVAGLTYDATDQRLFFYDTGSCTIRSLEITSGRVTTIAGTPGDCLESRDGPGAQAAFGLSGRTGLDLTEALLLASVGQTLYASDHGLLSTVDLSSPQHLVQSCAYLGSAEADPAVALATDPDDPSKLYFSSFNQIFVASLPCACQALPPFGTCPTALIAGRPGGGSQDGIGAAAGFLGISSLAVASQAGEKFLYVGDFNRVRRVALSSGEVQTVAGQLGQLGHQDASQGSQALFFSISALAAAEGQALFVIEEQPGTEKPDGSTALSYGWTTVRRMELAAPHAVSTLAGVSGSVFDEGTPESDGFGPQARFVFGSSAATVGSVLYLGEDSAIRAINLATGQVATAAGTLIQDFRYHAVRAVAADNGVLYAPTRAGEILAHSLERSTPPRRVSACVNPDGVLPLDVRAMSLVGSKLFYLDQNLGGVCRVDLGNDTGSGSLGTATRVYPPPGLEQDLDAYHQAKRLFIDYRFTGMAYDGDTTVYLAARNFLRLTEMATRPAALVRLDLQSSSLTQVKTSTPLPKAIWGVALLRDQVVLSGGSSHLLLLVDPKTGRVRSLGDGLPGALDSGDAGGPRFCNPVGIVSDGERLFVGEALCGRSRDEWWGNAIRQVDLLGESPSAADSLRVTTLLGPSPTAVVQVGSGHEAGVNWPAALALDAVTGKLLIADVWDNAVLSVD